MNQDDENSPRQMDPSILKSAAAALPPQQMQQEEEDQAPGETTTNMAVVDVAKLCEDHGEEVILYCLKD